MSILRNILPRVDTKNFFRNLTSEILGGVQNELWRRIDPAEGYAISKGDPNAFVPGDVEIQHITLVSADGKRASPITDQVKEIHIFENIVYPAMFCELSIADSGRFYENFPITGNEFITMTLKTKGRDNTVEYRFSVGQRTNYQVQDNNKMVTYTLQLLSPELKAAGASPMKPKEFKGTISDLVKDILTEDIGTEKPINIEPSTGIINKTITGRFPFAAIHEHYLDADNRRDNNGVYVFFENKRGYNLLTYEKMIKDGRKTLDRDGSDRRFVFSPDRNSDAGAIKFRNILAYNQSKFGDPATLVNQGGLNSTATTYDFAKGVTAFAQYKETQDGGQLPTSDTEGTSLIGTDFIRQYEKNSVMNKLIAVNSETRPNNNIAEVITKRNAFLQRLQQIEAQIMIYGDTDLAVGDVIECSWPSSSDAGDDPGTTRLDSGYYLITHLRHMIVNSDRPQHVIACNLMKSGMLGK